ncbi:heavy-metal-associated domain-containing protein [Sulfurimonas sp. MAG313]|nr:heavy metal-associated domain-containing protein [Sulfurimonas sp. MAG313]MDF1881418.1 heavy-metal-associated domain-containing protein [Sulfurimonas sp. MAG313]
MFKLFIGLFLMMSVLMAESSLKLEIGGMSCGGCANGINESFEEDLSKYKVTVDYKTAIMDISSKDGSDIDIKEVLKALEELGFKGKVIHNQ